MNFNLNCNIKRKIMSSRTGAYLFLTSILVLYFRLILSSLSSISDRTYLAVSTIILCGLGVYNFKPQKLKKRINQFLLALFILFLAYCLMITFLSTEDHDKVFTFLMKNTLSTVATTAFIFYLITDFSSKQITWAFDLLTRIALPIYSLIFICNNYFIRFSRTMYRPDDIVYNVFKNPAAVTNQRTVGALINLENSTTALVMLFSYFAYRYIFSKIKSDAKVEKINFFILLLGVWGVLTTTSVSSIITCTAILFAMIIQFLKYKLCNTKDSIAKIIVIIFLSINFIIFISIRYSYDLIDRFVTYFQDPKLLLSRIYFENTDNWLDFFINTQAAQAKNNGFGINEIHISKSFSNIGILPSLPWYLVFFSVLYFTFYFRKYSINEKSTYYMMLAGFLSSLHYAGIVAWPNNIVYCFCFVILMRKTLILNSTNS